MKMIIRITSSKFFFTNGIPPNRYPAPMQIGTQAIPPVRFYGAKRK